MSRFPLLAAAAVGALVLTGCSDSGSSDDAQADLSVSAAYMPQPVSDSMAAGFLTITNQGGAKDDLTSVTSDAGQVTVHRTVDSAMEEVKSLDGLRGTALREVRPGHRRDAGEVRDVPPQDRALREGPP